MPLKEQDICSFFIKKSKELEEVNLCEAKAWLLTGRSIIPKNFHIQLQSYQLEKRQKSIPGCARSFESLFRSFPLEVIEEVNEITNAVKTVTLSTLKETEDEVFLFKVFNELPMGMRMEVLMHRSEHTPILLEKCQSVLLMVKLFPDVVNQHGGNMLYTLSGCDADVHSPFRCHLVTELVPAVLRLCKNLQPSPSLMTLLSQCIEYYVLVDDVRESEDATSDSRWEKLYSIVDQVGTILNWKIGLYFRDALHSGSRSVETLFNGLYRALQHRSSYQSMELSYFAVVVLLRCITSYHEKLYASGKFGEKSRLTLVEVFVPQPATSDQNSDSEPDLPVITTVSPSCSYAASDSSDLLLYFITATKVWQIMQSMKGEQVEKEFLVILKCMKSLNFEKWKIQQQFEFDYNTYMGVHTVNNASRAHSSIKLASMYCGLKNYKLAAENAIKAINEVNSTQPASTPTAASPPADIRTNPMSRSRSLSGSLSSTICKSVNYSFYNCSSYTTDADGHVVPQRRVHFISENKSEILAYSANVLIQCFQSSLDLVRAQKDDLCVGHLITLIQLEWYSPPADMILSQILDFIRRKGAFRYFPYFADFVVEADILEQFVALGNIQNKPINLDLFNGGVTGNTSNSSKRMGTRGVERGAKNDFKVFMRKQILKSGRESLESLLIKFITLNKADIMACLEN